MKSDDWENDVINGRYTRGDRAEKLGLTLEEMQIRMGKIQKFILDREGMSQEEIADSFGLTLEEFKNDKTLYAIFGKK